MRKHVWRVLIMVAALPIMVSAAGANPIAEPIDRTALLNRFVDQLLVLHRRGIEGKKVESVERFGGYYGRPRFYREMTYREAGSGRLLSRVRRETEHSDRIHAIEVYNYGSDGRRVRDYLAWYLPGARNAPLIAAINLSHYAGDVRGLRQWDAFGERTFEQCSRWQGGAERERLFALEAERLYEAMDEPDAGVAATELYRRCVAPISVDAGPYLYPH